MVYREPYSILMTAIFCAVCIIHERLQRQPPAAVPLRAHCLVIAPFQENSTTYIPFPEHQNSEMLAST